MINIESGLSSAPLWSSSNLPSSFSHRREDTRSHLERFSMTGITAPWNFQIVLNLCLLLSLFVALSIYCPTKHDLEFIIQHKHGLPTLASATNEWCATHKCYNIVSLFQVHHLRKVLANYTRLQYSTVVNLSSLTFCQVTPWHNWKLMENGSHAGSFTKKCRSHFLLTSSSKY